MACGSLVWACLWVLRFVVLVICWLLVGCCFVLACTGGWLMGSVV